MVVSDGDEGWWMELGMGGRLLGSEEERGGNDDDDSSFLSITKSAEVVEVLAGSMASLDSTCFAQVLRCAP